MASARIPSVGSDSSTSAAIGVDLTRKRRLRQDEAAALLCGSSSSSDGVPKKSNSNSDNDNNGAPPLLRHRHVYWLDGLDLVGSPTPRVIIASLFSIVWRRICCDSEFYARVIDTFPMMAAAAVAEPPLALTTTTTACLELLLVSSSTHLAQLGEVSVRSSVRYKAESFLQWLLTSASVESLQTLAIEEGTVSMLAPLIALREYVPANVVLNVFARAIRHAYCREMVTFHFVQHCGCAPKTRVALVPGRSSHGTSITIASNCAHPFLRRVTSFDNVSTHYIQHLARHLVVGPLVDLRLLHSSFYHDQAFNGVPTTPLARAHALAIVPYRDNDNTHKTSHFARAYGLSSGDMEATAAALGANLGGGGGGGGGGGANGFHCQMTLLRPKYSSDYWLAVTNAEVPDDEEDSVRAVWSPETHAYFARHTKALLWLRIMPLENLFALSVTNASNSGDAFHLFAGDLRSDQQLEQRMFSDSTNVIKFRVYRAYARVFVELLATTLALCLDSGNPFGSGGNAPTVHVLRSCGGQVYETRDRFEASVLTALQCFEQPGALSSLLVTATSCVTSLLHAVTGHTKYSPSMQATQETAPSHLQYRECRAPPTHYAQWFSVPFQETLAHVTANVPLRTFDNDKTPSPPPPPSEPFCSWSTLEMVDEAAFELVPPPHFHVAIGFAHAQDDCINLYRSPETAVSTGAVRGAKLELNADSWRSLVALLPERMAASVVRHLMTTSTSSSQ